MTPVAAPTQTSGSAPVSPAAYPLATDSTVSLLPLAASGDHRAIEILMGRMRPHLERFGHGRLPRWARSRSETEDLVHESLVRALRHLPRFQHQSLKDFRCWLYTVFRNLVTDEKRFVGRVGVGQELPSQLEDIAQTPEEQVVEQSNVDVFERALRRLAPGERVFIIHRLQHAYSFQQLADEFDKPSADAARMTYNRALQRLRAEVERLVADPRQASIHN